MTNVTLEQMSGGNSTVGSLVDRKMVNVGDRSMSFSVEEVELNKCFDRSMEV